MARLVLALAFVATLCHAGLGAEKPAVFSEEPAVRKTLESYAEAHNSGDASAMASFWSKKGEYVTRSGDRFKGPDKIRPALEAYFAENKGTRVKVAVIDVQSLSPDQAVEKGIAVFQNPGDEKEEVLYAATLVREDKTWKIVSLEEQETGVPLSTIAQIGQLEWLIGDWVDKDENGAVETTFQWEENYAFITGAFRVTVAGSLEIEGTQIIGWDPLAKRIHSWIFDSKGGFGEGDWSRTGNAWTVKVKSVLGNGQTASSVNTYAYVNPDTFTWQSFGREVAGEPLPNVNKVTVVRKETQTAKSEPGKR
jgi:uncharacterized protein (TIGR02246 family)